MTGAGYSGKKSICVIFINGRAVDCSPLRRGLESVLSSTFQRPTKPFVFLVRARGEIKIRKGGERLTDAPG